MSGDLRITHLLPPLDSYTNKWINEKALTEVQVTTQKQKRKANKNCNKFLKRYLQFQQLRREKPQILSIFPTAVVHQGNSWALNFSLNKHKQQKFYQLNRHKIEKRSSIDCLDCEVVSTLQVQWMSVVRFSLRKELGGSGLRSTRQWRKCPKLSPNNSLEISFSNSLIQEIENHNRDGSGYVIKIRSVPPQCSIYCLPLL